ncbi:hypothetical protein Tco_1431407, partial [Tanacetum coccineum]
MGSILLLVEVHVSSRPERGKKASSKVDHLVIKRKKARASYCKLASKEGRRAESKRRKNDRDDHGRKVSSDDRRRRPWNLERDRVRDYEQPRGSYPMCGEQERDDCIFGNQAEKDESMSASFLITVGDEKNATRTQQHALFGNRKLARRKVKECSKIGREFDLVGAAFDIVHVYAVLEYKKFVCG